MTDMTKNEFTELELLFPHLDTETLINIAATAIHNARRIFEEKITINVISRSYSPYDPSRCIRYQI